MSNSMITIKEASQLLGIKEKVIYYHIDNGKIENIEGNILKSICDKIAEQQKNYIGIKAFLQKHESDRFNPRYAKYRNKYIDFLEENDYFGIEIVEPEEILFDFPEKEDFYVTKEDAQLLEYKSEQFFHEFGYSEIEKVQLLLKEVKGHTISKRYIHDFFADNEDIYTPAFTAFVRVVLDLPDINQLKDEDILAALEEIDVARTKTYFVNFLNDVARCESVKYHHIALKKNEHVSLSAYPYEDYVKLAKILFNADYDKEHKLTIKALENHKYAEMWMYLSCHYVCGWRSSDICERWIYPDLKDNENPFKINIDTLKEDILKNKISDETYEKVSLYVLKRIEMANYAPQKTGYGKLRSEIVPELRVFFGRLILIAEYHHITSGEGYMKSYRTSTYRNWVICKEFLGDEMYEITGRRYISSRRLNKCYLQGLEESARSNGATTLVAHVIAAFARNHASINTTAIYLKDHGLTGETAEVVLYMMMQRGVFGVSLYHALLAAYPEAFGKLTAKEQTVIMEKIPLKAYDIETTGIALIASERIEEVFREGKTEEAKEILKAMYSIAQGKGKAKDVGIFCKKKALGFACVHPTYKSCLANLCPYHVFTSEGIPALIKVIKDYKMQQKISDDKKYGVALKIKIIPAFQDIINDIIKEMSREDQMGLKRLIEEELNG